jgi:hypothetical protein
MRGKSIIFLAIVLPVLGAGEVSGLTVHEWGTFTSVADRNGASVPWVSLSPPADLPCFVYHLSQQCVKCGLSRVRMETPVVYFYSTRPLSASVHVDLPSGLITEWYPQAKTNGAIGGIEWSGVEVRPGAAEEFPNFGDRSHYYAARETDAAPLRVGGQQEKVLFYRGIGDLPVPIEPSFRSDGKLQIRDSGAASIPEAILFENQGGKSGFQVIHDLRGQALLEPTDLAGDLPELRRELAGALTAAGLYAKEAAAMIETWRDSWFDEGMRVFYIVRRTLVDAALPIRIDPQPQALERVFVGLVEILSPAMEQSLRAALASGDTDVLARSGRFVRAWIQQLQSGPGGVRISPMAAKFLAQLGDKAAVTSGGSCPTAAPTAPTEQR